MIIDQTEWSYSYTASQKHPPGAGPELPQNPSQVSGIIGEPEAAHCIMIKVDTVIST